MLYTEMTHRMRRGGAREAEMLLPGGVRALQIGMHIGAVEYVARAIGVDHLVLRDGERREVADVSALVAPDQPVIAERHAADPHALRAQKLAECRRVHAELFAHALRADRHVD